MPQTRRRQSNSQNDSYLHGIHKTEISKALAKNRTFIRKRLMGEAGEPDPSQQTDET
jgi:hypothetical protein